jgi:hypothetical protein
MAHVFSLFVLRKENPVSMIVYLAIIMIVYHAKQHVHKQAPFNFLESGHVGSHQCLLGCMDEGKEKLRLLLKP